MMVTNSKMYVYYILAILSTFLFLYGFFPITNPSTNINNEPPTHINNISLNPQVYNSDIKKTIVVVIDALRLDFVNIQYMPLTSHIIEKNGCFNTIIAETPTVTLPRIKALTTGNVPQFVDLVLNLASTEILQDSLIHSLFKKGKRIVFYGDDTWLKLFPDFFMRYEGTNSFFVKDFKEVDDNVTRNVNLELEKRDWDVMILHYLGLDHIGHVYGPFSSHIPIKLKEMDEVIYGIYSKMLESNEKFLITVTGDHGMRDSGGHGGSSYSERYVPLVAIGLHCNNDSFFQIDIPINLAVLLGLKIPSTSIGQIRPNLFPISLEKYLFALRYNNLLLLDKANLCEDHFMLATKFHELFIKSSNEIHGLKAIEFYKNCSDIISNYLIKSSVKQNFNFLIISIFVMFNLIVLLTQNLISNTSNREFLDKMQYIIYPVVIFMQLVSLLNTYLLLFVIILACLLIRNIISLSKSKGSFHTLDDSLKLLILISIIHPFTFFSSSFIEEEHQFWYFFNNSLMVYIILSKTAHLKNLFIWLSLLSVLRFLRTINSTGDKWASYPDFSDWLLKNDNYCYNQIFFIFGLVATFFVLKLLNKDNIKMDILNFFILSCILLLKSTNRENVLLGKLIWILILCHVVFFFDCPKIIVWILISSLLLKPYNVILIPYCILTSMAICNIFHNTTFITLSHFWLGNVLYFVQGHSNSLASVDISVGYVGLSEYQPILVILQVLWHTYSFPVLCHFLIVRSKPFDTIRIWSILLCNRLYINLVTCIITVVFRHHLFVWSVFAPKLFIESVHLIFLFIEFIVFTCVQNFQSFLKYLRNR